MSINSRVQKSSRNNEEPNMIRSIKLCGYRGLFLEPYASSLQLISNYASTKANLNVQSLPRLPVPKLNDTLNKYLKTVKPFLSDEEFANTAKLVNEFGSQGGVGIKLQSLLEKRAEKHVNWLEEWWLNTAYLEYRDPVVVYSSPGLVFPFRKFNNQDEQLHYAAKTLLASLEYKALIDGDKIPVEMMGKSPLDMSQYKKIFGTCRIPCEKRDKLSFNDTKYFTVIHNNHIFHVDLWGNDNKRLSEDQIVHALKKVIELSKSPATEAIGVLTSDNRDNWAKAYQALSKDKVNRESLGDVERSLAVLCLDAACGLWRAADKGARQTLAAAQTIHGGGSAANAANRWFDKTVQFIVGADGVTGLTYEHSPAEGQPIAVLTDFIINYIDKGKSSTESSSSPKDPVKLNFNVSSDVVDMISTAKTNVDKLVADLELNCFTFDKYGKNFIKSQKLSPDSYLQMAMQYAFYRLHATPGAHYESAATRMYTGGRTETIRSCSPESVEFARAMLDAGRAPHLKLHAMRQAIDAHKNYTVQALQGFGVDRHLLGLKLIALENGIEIPKLYSDEGYRRSAHMRISTSQVACKCDGFMCYGPLVVDGYATCYNPRDDDVNFGTSAFRRHPDTGCGPYRAALERSLHDMHDLLLLAAKSKL
ncbi:PREDICTED: carnitine O-acetyltransferase-like isoform X1 [Papilio xuthus]|uniref:Carnitine O-acetyltransferase-like isoform X1 n=2 Tax=Papilio xuthus TaxID=66420 RepID=A0AAJ6ZXR8_PAPXU|nr:PREDICTED: carnitine O-acetyltransferase-like isoform X1 [Papilio xuthus]XP_013181172.1 PREDICTED: carnitine O-acetyltransferase-like isoform X1 [Papilio xuthus]XP_013181173.1 PREDICTED: carnitine O-acetyltransferase-like isoform X1 [Papilio xuthus]